MDGTVASAKFTFFTAELWSFRIAVRVSALLGSKSVPMVSGLFNIIFKRLLEIWVSVQIASSLVRSHDLSAVWMSSLKVTPSEPVLFGGLLWSLVFLFGYITVSVEIALSHFIVHISHAVLISLFFVSELSPVSHGCIDWVSFFESGLKVWISLKIALSLFLIDLFTEHEVITLMLYIFTFVSIILTFFQTAALVKTWAFRIKVRICFRDSCSRSNFSCRILFLSFNLINKVNYFIFWVS